MKLNVQVRSTPVDEIAGPAGHRKLTIGARRGIQRALALVERHHKKNEWIRSGRRLATQDTHPDKLTVRTGTLSRSYTREIVERDLAGYYGSDVVYSRVHEFGFPARNIPKRPGLQNTVDATKAEIEKVMADSIAQELTRGQ